MADFTLKRRKDFYFSLEDDPDKVYVLPALKSLSFEDAQAMTKIDDEQDLVKKGNLVRDFILKYAPELEDKDLGGMEYFEIFNAYGLNEGKEAMGESKASRRSSKNTARR
jgi:hypothetical protein